MLRFRMSHGKYFASSLLFVTAIGFPALTWAQTSTDVIRIGSPSEWSQYESHWKQLINSGFNKPPRDAAEKANARSTSTASDPKITEQTLIKNLRVNDLRLVPIIKLNGSSQVMGQITNGNRKAVTVSSVNLEILDSFGNLVQTSAPTPEPSMIPAGETVTFQKQLYTVPPDGGFQVRLSRSNPFTIRGGV
jgi:hypothetical protein